MFLHQIDHWGLTLISKKLTSVSISLKTKLYHKLVLIITVYENVIFVVVVVEKGEYMFEHTNNI